MKRTVLKRRTPLSRSAIRRAYRPPSRDDRALATRFHIAVTQNARCARCRTPHGLEAHHAIPKGWLRRNGLADPRVIWDERNGIALCADCHERHTNRSRVLPRRLLPASVWRFAGAHGIEWRLELEYPA
jgi:5-methylcytosine-specific restriction endonuclease McrA